MLEHSLEQRPLGASKQGRVRDARIILRCCQAEKAYKSSKEPRYLETISILSVALASRKDKRVGKLCV